jgi:hypothetical protein
MQEGIGPVAALKGGYGEWERLGYPTEPVVRLS